MSAQYNQLPASLRPLLARTVVIVAHPDDETIACGGLMQFMKEICVVFATDGAPKDEFWWKKYGSREAYANLRQQEARAALAEVGVTQAFFLGDHESFPHEFSDQMLYRVLPSAFDELLRFAQCFQPDALLTLAYEGGHPDHDCAAFLSSRLGARLGVPVFEAPLYHRIEGIPHFQEWTCPTGEPIEINLENTVLARKRAMFSQYKSQFTTLSEGFKPGLERFRVQANYDFSQPPHRGKLNYEVWEWPITSAAVCRAFADFDSTHPQSNEGVA